MSLRFELVTLARRPDADKAELARRFGVSRKTLYKWLGRCTDDAGPAAVTAALRDRSRRPTRSPHRTADAVEREVLAVRQAHPAWGPRKIHAVLSRPRDDAARPPVPSTSTIGRILHRHGRIDPRASDDARRYQRFEHENPNDLWQMDFKGDFALTAGGRCHPLTVLDDHSRYALVLAACPDQRLETVLGRLTEAFRRYGLPRGACSWTTARPGA